MPTKKIKPASKTEKTKKLGKKTLPKVQTLLKPY